MLGTHKNSIVKGTSRNFVILLKTLNYLILTFFARDYKNTEAFAGMFSQIGELYNVKVQSAGIDSIICMNSINYS